jgi:glycosyltransferase involved in cell wall biosynthesis
MVKIGLCLIVKNESHIIRESLTCTLPLIDTFCIVDTGSTDNTIEVIRSFYEEHGIVGEIHEREWKNFGHNRSEALALCDGKMDYILVIDADDLMSFPSNGRHILEDLLKNNPSGLQIMIKQESIEYWRTQVFKANDGWKYFGVLHEYPGNNTPNPNILKLPTSMYMQSRRLGGRSLNPNKLLLDIEVLKNGLKEEPENERYVFYLANAYRDAGDFANALKFYKQRVRMGKWPEEAWYAAYRVGDCYKHLNNIPKFEYWMQRAHLLRPTRAEPMHNLTEYFRSKTGDLHKAYAYCLTGLKIPYPKDDVLFVEKFPHDGGFLYEKTILDYYVHPYERHVGLQDSTNYLLKYSTHRDSVISNLKFYVSSIQSTSEKIDIPSVFGPEFRPSAISVYNYPLANIRFVNYLPPTDGAYRTKDGSPIQTLNARYNFDTREITPMVEETCEKLVSRTQGLEDLRVYLKNDRCYFTAVNYHEYSPDISIVHGEYEDSLLKNCKAIQSPTQSKCEKNWLYIPGTDAFIYSWSPLRIGTINNGEMKFVAEIETPCLFEVFRGSAPPVLHNGKWLVLVHFCEYSSIRNYYHCFVELEYTSYNVLQVSLPFRFKDSSIEYCISTRIVSNAIECYVSFFDENPHTITIPLDALEWNTVSEQQMKIVRIPQNLQVYWAGAYSRCYPNGSIEQYLREIADTKQVSFVMSQSDSIFSDKELKTTLFNTNETRIVLTPSSSYKRLRSSGLANTTPIVCMLSSRDFSDPNMVLLPLDDDTFHLGINHIFENVVCPDWNQRIAKIHWRGNPGGYERPSIRYTVVKQLFDHPYADVRFAFEGDMGMYGNAIESKYKTNRCGLETFVQHKYLLIIDGTGIASNHQWVFASGAVPVMITHPKNNWWFKKFLKPMENYVPIRYDLSDLEEKLEWLASHDAEAQQIAISAKQLSDTIFTSQFQKAYISDEIERILIRNHAPKIIDKFKELKSTPSDINEHLNTLFEYSCKCSSIVECGVRDVVSSYAFALGLMNTPNNSYVLIDPYKSQHIEPFLEICKRENVHAKFVHESDLTCSLIETDMLFIDTWHIYGQLKRELEYWHSSVKKYIIMHDTTVDEIEGESLRSGCDVHRQSIESGFPVEEITKGLWPAIKEFLHSHSEWRMERRFTNNNGLTILSRV